MTRRPPARRRSITASIGALLVLGAVALSAGPASAASYQRISGAGSSWAGNAVLQWQADVKNQGVTVDYNPNGSSQGRKDFAAQVSTDFTVSEIPYRGDTADPRDTSYPDFGFSQMPMVAGGTSFMYNLPVNGQRFTELKLSQQAAAGIFSGQILKWNDPLIAADNPGVNLPEAPITVVVRSDGSGATAQFTLWMLRQFPDSYRALCSASGACDGQHATSYFPAANLANVVPQSGSVGVTTYTQNTPYTINYDEYSYAQQVGYPVAQLKNAAGFYTVPSEGAVAVALIKAAINNNASDPNYLSQDLSAVYQYQDPRAYALSAYSYFFVPTQTTASFDAAKGATLGFFTQYSLCEGQRKMGPLGYSPLPMNLVLAALEEVRKIPGIDADTLAKLDAVKNSTLDAAGGNPCNNPTFQPGDDPSHNLLVDTAPFPAGCDDACQAPWRQKGAGVAASGPSFTAPETNGAPAAAAAPTDTTSGTTTATTTTTDQTTPVAAAVTACDADTGTCAGTSTAATTTAAGLAVTPVSTVLPGQQGWAGPQTLMVLAALFGALLLVGPPLVSRFLGRSTAGRR
ncbi:MULTISPECIES: substrate-binding domain-containing protein [unclassified Rathayibacter]|uniref:substrate-binding domain-containing protein n=1 Tax=unclassified Rathayibacter TaxID=2609250 RepID=UPI00188BCFDB|nr:MULTISPECIES: substrate-binding domain-containing protein [unclassified Rathayibacter]MBF4462742.1 substrate-binding domain-containing protein [Rathayibacter sp. VKM Ac-2879]MBF4504156.1 substrate-binding domain-containing protein [Rathayibacter sp. VKM Ac-2878]